MKCLAIGIILSLVSSLVVVLMMRHIDDFGFMGGGIIFGFGIILTLVGFILFTTGWFSYSRKRMNILSSFGWWILSIGAWAEVYLLIVWLHWIRCYGNQPGENCKHELSFIPYCVVPLGGILFGLMLVYIGKKHNNVQSDNPSGRL